MNYKRSFPDELNPEELNPDDSPGLDESIRVAQDEMLKFRYGSRYREMRNRDFRNEIDLISNEIPEDQREKVFVVDSIDPLVPVDPVDPGPLARVDPVNPVRYGIGPADSAEIRKKKEKKEGSYETYYYEPTLFKTKGEI